jgi:hypothetical protein
MNNGDLPALQLRLDLLEQKLRGAERWSKIKRFGWAILSALVFLLLGISGHGLAQPQSQKLRLRELDIVDDQGRERIVIAAPLPDPVVNGRQGHRIRVVSAAVQFKAPNGNEQGGIALSDDGSFMFGIDDETGRERAHLYYLPKQGSGVLLQGENSKETVSMVLPNGGRNPKLEMTDLSGKSIAVVPMSK